MHRGGSYGCGGGVEQQGSIWQGIAELISECADTESGHSGVAFAQASKDDVEHPTRRGEIPVELNAAEEWTEQSGHCGLTKAKRLKSFGGCLFRLSEQTSCFASAHLGAQSKHAELVREWEYRAADRLQQLCPITKRIAEFITLSVDPGNGARIEHMHVQGLQVDRSLYLGVGREHDLKSPVKSVSVDEIGANPASYAVTCLDECDGLAGLHETSSAGEASNPCAYDGGINRVRKL